MEEGLVLPFEEDEDLLLLLYRMDVVVFVVQESNDFELLRRHIARFVAIVPNSYSRQEGLYWMVAVVSKREVLDIPYTS